jgi:hypothetical protein
MKHVAFLVLGALSITAPFAARAEVALEKCGLSQPGEVAVFYDGLRLTERLSTYRMDIRFTSDPLGVEIFSNRLNPSWFGGGELFKLDLDGLSVTYQTERYIDTKLCLNDPASCDLSVLRNEIELAKLRLKKRWWPVMKDEPREALQLRLSPLDCAGKLVNNFVKRLRLTPKTVNGLEMLGGEPASALTP